MSWVFALDGKGSVAVSVVADAAMIAQLPSSETQNRRAKKTVMAVRSTYPNYREDEEEVDPIKPLSSFRKWRHCARNGAQMALGLERKNHHTRRSERSLIRTTSSFGSCLTDCGVFSFLLCCNETGMIIFRYSCVVSMRSCFESSMSRNQSRRGRLCMLPRTA